MVSPDLEDSEGLIHALAKPSVGLERLRTLWVTPRPIPERALAFWTTYTPEPNMRLIIAHRQQLFQKRRETRWITTQEFDYPLPRLRQIEEKPEVFATAIDTDGLINVRMRHGRDKINKLYLYEYVRPKVWFWSEDLRLTMKFADMMLAPTRPIKPRPPRQISTIYVAEMEHAPAVMACYLAQPHLIKWRERADQVIALYKHTPSIRTH